MLLSATEAIAELGEVRSAAELQALIAKLDISAGGTTTILYSGSLPDGSNSGQVARRLALADPNLRIVDGTEAAKFLDIRDGNNPALFNKLTELFGGANPEEPGSASNRFLFGAVQADGSRARGAWDDVSRRFAAETSGSVRLIVHRSEAGKVFAATELPELLENPAVTSIEGIAMADLKAIEQASGGGPSGLKSVFERVRHCSEINIAISGLNGTSAGDFLDTRIFDLKSYLASHSDGITRLADLYRGIGANGLTPAELAERRLLSNSMMSLIEGTKVSGGTRLLSRLGAIGNIASFASAVAEADAAEAAGDSQRAQDIMGEWAADAVGSGVGSFVAGALAGIGIAAAAAAGVTLAAPLAGAIVLGTAFVGGFFGADKAAEYYRLLSDLDGNARRDLFDRLSNALFGVHSTLTSPLPTDLNGGRYSIDASLSAAEIVGHARSDIAWRYALRELNGFVITDVDYTRHNEDRSLDLYDPVSGEGSMSEAYLANRTAMLMWKLRFDRAHHAYNSEWDSDTVEGNWDYTDLSIRLPGGLPLTLSIDGSGLSVHDHQVVFGSAGGEQIAGEADSDYLYGMKGNDTLIGQGGDDHLDGGTGQDSITGGGGSDTLMGGAGLDTYEFSGQWGADVLRDTEGTIKVAGPGTLDGTGAKRFGSGIWKSANGRITYVHAAAAADQASYLLIIVNDSVHGGTIRIEGWSQGQLGITLGNEQATPPPAASLVGDFVKATNTTGTQYLVGGEPGNYLRAADSAGTDDVLNSGAAANLVLGLGGNDGLAGGDGNDTLDGGAGNDLLLGGTGEDELRGGGGDDVIFGSAVGTIATPHVVGFTPPLWPAGSHEVTRGFSWVSYRAPGPRVSGDPSDPTFRFRNVELVGASGNAVWWNGTQNVVEASGNLIDGGAGKDYIAAGTGADIVHGGDDDDDIFGLHDADVLFGDAGDDFIAGDGLNANAGIGSVQATSADALGEFHGNDVIDGGDGKDVLVGQGGADELFGGTGDDWMWGDQEVEHVAGRFHGDDYLDGGLGIDHLLGGGRNDTLFGGAGADRLEGDDGRADLPVEFHGRDYLDGEDGNDEMQGGGRDDTLYGGTGHDSLWGDAGAPNRDDPSYLAASVHGADFLDGEDGDDYLQGEGGDDTLLGSAGADTLIGDDRESRLGGADHGRDELDGGAGNDSLVGQGDRDTLAGGDGDDTLRGDGSQDEIGGNFHGDDMLDGEAGNDRLEGGGGKDTLQGGAGNDTLEGDAAESVIEGRFHGADSLAGGDGDDVVVGGGGDDTVEGSAGNDVLTGDAEELATNFHGADMLAGGDGDDSLFGDGGNDVLMGDDGSDQLQGGAGNDTLDGGSGADVLAGGAGDDIYRLSLGESSNGTIVDTIVDNLGRDTIVLDGVAEASLQVALNGQGQLVIGQSVGASFGVRDGLTSSLSGLVTATGWTSFDRFVGSRLLTAVDVSTAAQSGQLLGGALNDNLTAQHTDTRVSGGRGSDAISITTGAGAVFTMGLGDGTDTVTAVRRNAPTQGQAAPQNILELGAGFSASQVRLYRVGSQSFVLALNGEGEGLRFNAVPDASGGVPLGDQPVDVVRFADGSTLNWQQIAARGVLPAPTATNGSDVLTMTPLGDEIDGLSGNDLIEGLAGNDSLSGGEGNDTLVGGVGDDLLYANAGADSILGGEGRDYLVGGAVNSNATLDGGEGDDQYSFTFGYYTGVQGHAVDASLASNDTYHVSASAQVGGSTQTWTIDDAGGTTDRLSLTSSLTTAANTKVLSTGTGFMLSSQNLVVHIRNAIDATGRAGPGSIESVSFLNGTVWTADQLRTASQLTTAGNDSVVGFGTDDVLQGLAGGDTLDGFGGNDSVLGGGGYDVLRGGAGNDTLDAGADGGILVGGAGNDRYLLRAGDGAVAIGVGSRGSSDDSGVDVLDVAAPASAVTLSYIRGGSNHVDTDTVVVRFKDNSATATIKVYGTSSSAVDAVEQIRLSDGSTIDVSQFVASFQAPATTGNDNITLTSLDDAIDLGAGNDLVYSKGGNDSIRGGVGNDAVYAGYGDDTVDGGSGDDTIYLGGGNDAVLFSPGSGRDTVATETGITTEQTGRVLLGVGITTNDLRLKWSSAAYTFPYNANGGYSELPVANGLLTLAVAAGGDSISFYVQNYASISAPLQSVSLQDGTTWSLASLIALANKATAGGDLLVDAAGIGSLGGGAGNDTLFGFNGENMLDGGAGDDSLVGGADQDRLIGGIGNDTLEGGSSRNTVVYSRGDGDDLVTTAHGGSTAIEFGAGIAVADIALLRQEFGSFVVSVAGGGTIRFSGIDRSDQLPAEIRFADGTVWDREQLLQRVRSGTPDADNINGFIDNDSIAGGNGNDLLRGGVGSDTLLGGAGNDSIDGSGLGGGLFANGQWDADILNGGAGNDALTGGDGWTTFVFDSGFGSDVIVQGAQRNAATGYTLSFGPGIAPANVVCSYRTFGGYVVSVPSTGDSVEFTLRSGDAVRFADGTVWTSADLDARLVHASTGSGDLIVGTAGADTVDAAGGADYVTAGAGNDVVRGGGGDDYLYGDAGNDTLAGGSGNDMLSDSDGSDRYEFALGDGHDTIDDSAGSADVLVLAAGIDTSNTSVLYDPANAGSGRYTLTFGGSANSVAMRGIDSVTFLDGTVWTAATIDSLARSLSGTAGNDTMTGSASADRLLGLAGNDQLSGAGGDDWLDGGTGADTMNGGSGNDTFVVDDIADSVVESSGQGSDKVFSSVTYTLGSNVESLELTGAAAVAGTGNSLGNKLTGNSAANTLSGGTGADTMAGAAGNDTYVVDSSGDVITELAGEGTDLVQSGISTTLAANVESLTLTGTSAVSGTGNELKNSLTGNSANNTLTAGAGDDTLDGGAGNDTLVGGTGNDDYTVNVSSDVVTELAGGGTDTVRSSVTLTTLAANVENLVLTGSSAINGTGNTLDNLLTGNSANNTLTGAAGNDTLDGGTGNDTALGGAGNDTYFVNVSTDVVTENANEGTDTVHSAATLTLGNNVENLTLTGTAAINGTGNTANNALVGNNAANVLAGAAGDDTYDGAGGNDTLTDASTTSSDVYRWGTGAGLDVLSDAGGSADRIDLTSGITSSNLRLTRNGNNLELAVTGFADKLTINGWYVSASSQIETIRFNDGSSILASQVQSLVGAMATMSAGGAAADSVGIRRTILPATAAVDLAASIF